VVANKIDVRPSAAARAIVIGDIEVLALLTPGEAVDFLCGPVVGDLTDIRGWEDYAVA